MGGLEILFLPLKLICVKLSKTLKNEDENLILSVGLQEQGITIFIL